jgi:3-phosphoshikimate 1-carboxyvinyltransferase
VKEVVSSPASLEGNVIPPGDKSISHRAALLNSIADGVAKVSNFCVGDDRASMLRCLRGVGADITQHDSPTGDPSDEYFIIKGRGIDGLDEPSGVLDSGNSGTTMRLVSGLLAAQPFFSILSGDRSLNNRPMKRIVTPLSMMGATIMGRKDNSLAPLAIRGGGLVGIKYDMPVASAQLKSSILIAGLYADGETTVNQPALSRDHTERMIGAMGADVREDGLSLTIRRSSLSSMDVRVPCDISGASFWLVAGCCHPNASVRVKGVGINPSRTGVLDVLKAMGANVRMENVVEEGGEPSADLVAETSQLEGTEIAGAIIPRVIDELPVLALAACFAKGTTVIRDAQELRVKESDRISATVEGLTRLGAKVEETPDGMVIYGGATLKGAETRSHGDHRIAMTMGIAGLVTQGQTTIEDSEAASVSYPEFWDTLKQLQGLS